MNADQDNILLAQEETGGIYTPYTFDQGYVVILRNQQICIKTAIFEICYDLSCNFTIVERFTELAVGTAFAGCHQNVAIPERSGGMAQFPTIFPENAPSLDTSFSFTERSES